MFYRSERLFLRPPFPEDSGAICRGIGDAGVAAMLSRAPWPYRMADAEQFCASEGPAMAPRFLITLPDSLGAPVIGGIGIHAEGDEVELGYWIARNHWSQGYASEAGRAVLEIARTIGHSRIVAGHFLDNPASGRVLRKLGFAETGEIRPTYCRARGGELVLARRYAIDLAVAELDLEDGQMRAA